MATSFKEFTANAGKNILHWTWTESVLYWLIMSGGTMAGCVFLIASVWLSINSSVHGFILLFLPDAMTVHITEMATTAFVGLPEVILPRAFVTTIEHYQVYRYDKKAKIEMLWAILFGMPTIIFLGLSLYTLGSSVMSTSFRMPEWLIVTRALAGFFFAFISLLHHYLGVPENVDRLKKRDNIITELKAQITELQGDYKQQTTALHADYARQLDELRKLSTSDTQTLHAGFSNKLDALQQELSTQKAFYLAEIERYQRELSVSNNRVNELYQARATSDEDALQAYSGECIKWLMSGIKSAKVDDIALITGIHKRRINTAIVKKHLQTTPANKDLVLLSSLIPWMKTVQPTGIDDDNSPALHIVNGR